MEKEIKIKEKNNNKFKVLTIIVLLISVVGLSIAYAQITSNLKIEGDAKLGANAWNISFINMDGGTTYGNAEIIQANRFRITSYLTASGYVGKLNTKGDKITYKWFVKNRGKIDANLANINMGTLTCTPSKDSGLTQIEATQICSKLKLTIKYDGVILDPIYPMNDVRETKLLSGESRPLELSLELSEQTNILGSVDVNIGVYAFSYNQLEEK